MSSTTAVSPATKPVAWSSRMPVPKRAAGWMSTARCSEASDWMWKAISRRPTFQRACAKRWQVMAWKPLYQRYGRSACSAAGSRSRMARMSPRACWTMVASRAIISSKTRPTVVASDIDAVMRSEMRRARPSPKSLRAST